MLKIYRIVSLLCLIVLFSLNGFGQVSVDGFVLDSKSDATIPMVNVYFKGTNIGTISDSTGYFKLELLSYNDTIVFSSVGYHKKEIKVSKIKSPFEVYLNPDEINLNEISVKPDDSWVRFLLERMNDAKTENNPDKHLSYSYEKYTKWEYHIANVDSALMYSGPFKNYKSYFKTAFDGSKYLPVYLSEQVVQNQFQNKPLKQKSVIVADNTQGLGVLGDYEIGGYTAGLNNQYNFYNNYIKVFEESFVSPAASNGWFYYKYYLVDSVQHEGYKHYQILFTPRRKHDKVFRGHMIIDDKDFSIVSVDAVLSSKTNMNFLKEMKIDVTYEKITEHQSFYKEQTVYASFDYLPFEIPGQNRRMELEFNEYSSFKDVKINPKEEVVLSARNLSYESVKLSGSYTRDTTYWSKARHIPLSNAEKEIALSIDSINQIPLIKILDNTTRMMMTGYYDLGKFELGPYMNFLQFNKVEGVRFFAGARTSKEISKNWMLWGGLGYGLQTEKISGLLGGGYKFEHPKRRVIEMYYDDRYIRMGENRKILYLYENMLTPSENNLVSAFFVRDPFDELLRQKEIDFSYEHEWRTGFSSQFNLTYKSQYSPEFYPFVYNGMQVKNVNAYEATIDFRFSFKEKVIDDEFMRLYLSTDYPILHLALTTGQAEYAGQVSRYQKIHTTIKHGIYMGQTLLNYAFEGGVIFGKVPYTMLELPRGNESFGYYLYDFNMLNYLEFAHDKYLHAYFEYHLNGFLFNRMPLLRSLGLREVISAKTMIGSLSEKQFSAIKIPETVSGLDQPYLEVGAGLENIMRLIRLEALWRVTPQSKLNVPQFGLRAKISLNL
ncbi:DUF5686 family protein [Carboxylicivirga caseinilyticus]|uniref:DUF5686 and carboxypeptidase-like regulatory domain-containing protein n=1 Tax=Carboxylicivirga caseinilyticus TaxID=3417572 RepID=UPI003D33D299|nr:carboxypeptidase-like regulatory domain-containing protein [Marinilabiliaceae bacterium A049]